MAKHNYKTTEAHRAKSKRWYEAHKQHCLEVNRQYRRKHRAEIRAYQREWERKRREQKAIECPPKERRLTPEQALERKRERVRKWRAEHPDVDARNAKRWREEKRAEYVAKRELAAARSRAWRAANLERDVQTHREWKKNNAEKIREYNRNRKARLLSKNGRHTAEHIGMLYQLQEGQCAGCNALLQKSGRDRFHVDHIVPLLPKDGQQPGSNDPENLQLLCPRCNLSKSNLSQEQWDRREGRLR